MNKKLTKNDKELLKTLIKNELDRVNPYKYNVFTDLNKLNNYIQQLENLSIKIG